MSPDWSEVPQFPPVCIAGDCGCTEAAARSASRRPACALGLVLCHKRPGFRKGPEGTKGSPCATRRVCTSRGPGAGAHSAGNRPLARLICSSDDGCNFRRPTGKPQIQTQIRKLAKSTTKRERKRDIELLKPFLPSLVLPFFKSQNDSLAKKKRET